MIHEIGLYIHVPFCKAKCYYCDFNSHPNREDTFSLYFNALKSEIASYTSELKDYTVKSIFIGGGTPSYVDAQYICDIMNLCKQNFNINKDAEISIESNPGTLTHEKLMAYRASGINRISIGLQAWQNRLLQSLGRIHSIDEFVENFKLARKVGFKNINTDLIFGLPTQTLDDWTTTIHNILLLEPEHISCYSLKIEEGTVFGEKLESGQLTPMNDELDRELYYFTIEQLRDRGYKHYEISNFAKDGHECRHNLVYWKADEYIGFGAGSHSYFRGKRYNNVYDVDEYIRLVSENGILVENIQVIGREEMMEEFMILGLRLVDGVSVTEFKERFDEDIYNVFGEQIDRLQKRQLIKLDGDRLRLTAQGLDLGNEVFMEFV